MPEEKPSVPSTPPSTPATPPESGTSFDISEEYGTAAKNLPPAKVVAIGIGLIVVIALVIGFAQRAKVSASGSIDDVTSVEMPNQNSVMVALAISMQNHGKKRFYIHDIQSELETGSGKFTDEAASGVDFERYFQALPALKEHALAPLKPETMIEPGGETKGTIIVSFPVTAAEFANRKSIKVTIRPYDQPVPLVLTK
jgi:hypothetical protein